ncbi:MAG: FtsX-like permease family protein [Solirubrobacterales bacterium]
MIRSLAWRSVTARKLRAILNGAGIVLGVALIFAVLSLSKTIVTTFDELFGSVYEGTDIVVSGEDLVGTVDQSIFEKVKAINGVETATGVVGSVVSRVVDGKVESGQSAQINVQGIDPDQPDLSGAETLDGREVGSGDEIALDEAYASANGIKVGDSLETATQTGLHTFKVVGIFRLGDGLDFGGQGFGAVPLDTGREVFDIPSGFSEIDVAIEKGASVTKIQEEIEAAGGEGIDARTPSEISEDINQQIQGFNIILYFFAAMSLFVGGFLILNSFTMTIAQRLREIGMLRTLGGSRKLITRMILVEAVFLAVLGSVLGIGLGFGLAIGLTELVGNFGLPIGGIKYPPEAFIIAPLCGIGASLFGALRPARRAGRIPPIRAVLTEHRAEPLKLGRRISVGSLLVVLGLIGVFILASSSTAPLPVVLAGAFGVIFLFSGVIMLGPVVVPALVRVLSWPLRKLTPIEGRLASDSAKANPVRTASTASGLMIGIALVAAIGSLGASFIGSVSDDLDRELETDFTIQSLTANNGGPQAGISPDAIAEVSALPGAKLVEGTHWLWVTSGYAKNWTIYGVDPDKHLDFTNPDYVAGGTPPEVYAKIAAGEITVPEALAEAKKTKIGDTVELEGPRGKQKFKVAAFQKGNSTEAASIVMSNEKFLSLYGIEQLSQILVLADSEDARSTLREGLDKLVAGKYPSFEVLSNEEIKKQIEDQINQVFSIFYVIMLVAIIVSLLGVVNTLLMNVLERTREIGVLRAIGSSRRQIRRVIVQESLLLTLAGAILGLVVGIALGYAFVRGIAASGQSASFHPPVAIIVMVALLSVIFGVIAALLPARRAARMNVIEAVSYE